MIRANGDVMMRKAITVLELAIGGAFAIAIAAYVANGALLMAQLVF